ncbi:MAG: 4-hydroxythreonine-4-phosphate dehydrogenase PdxA [Deltaproteobacteria bacterium]|nr:4-hydroxythreonine-4-phosphate dehydrogenase PdxA [Deltaproteobacteria bacterium]MCB9489525.1 4-hydroxythreonine-4-phosphate dehydrogenase PdxA [Deltaproteobacteria bacterium]
MGDPAGIGPEVIAKALPLIVTECEPVLVGLPGLFNESINRYAKLREDDPARRVEVVMPSGVVDPAVETDPAPAFDLATRGRLQTAFIRAAVAMAMDRKVDAVVTGPITKEALDAAGIDFPGHTEMIADLCGIPTPVMMLAGPKLRVVPLTIHMALRDVPDVLTRALVETRIRILDRDLRRYFGLETPRIALTGLNPHAGEGGMFGTEEIDVLAPCVASLRKEGIEITGPYPADTIFVRAVAGDFDVVVAPTHDQALIPLKLLHFDEGVNVTLGLPIIRTSPDHGTAPDIAGQGVASPTSMIAAVRMAMQMARAAGLTV